MSNNSYTFYERATELIKKNPTTHFQSLSCPSGIYMIEQNCIASHIKVADNYGPVRKYSKRNVIGYVCVIYLYFNFIHLNKYHYTVYDSFLCIHGNGAAPLAQLSELRNLSSRNLYDVNFSYSVISLKIWTFLNMNYLRKYSKYRRAWC